MSNLHQMSNLYQVQVQSRAEPDLGTFEEFWRVFPRRTHKPLARAKWDAITGAGLKTRTLDRDSGQYIEIFLQATPAAILDGAKRYARAQIDMKTYRLKDGG